MIGTSHVHCGKLHKEIQIVNCLAHMLCWDDLKLTLLAVKQDALAGSPAKSTEMGADKASPKRARERSCDKRAPKSGGSRSSCSCSSGHMSTDRTMPDSDTYAGRPRLEPMGVMRGGKGRGGGKGKKGSKGRSRHC